ncbi:MAG: PAS domain S-box protein [Thermodesulfobacteriota bacterium]
MALAPPVWADESLRVGVFQNKPIAYIEDGANGLFVEVLDHVAREEGWDIKYIPCNLQECFELLQAEELDLLTSVGKHPKWQDVLTLSQESIWKLWGTIYSHDIKIDHLFALKDKKIGLSKDSQVTFALKPLLAGLDIPVHYVEFANHEAAFAALHGQGVDVVAANNTRGIEELRRSDIRQTPIVFSPFTTHFAISAGGRHQEKLAVIDRYVEELKEERESFFCTFQRQWLRGETPYWTGKRIGLIGAIIFLIMVAAMALWRFIELSKVRAGQERLSHAIDQASESVVITDLQGTILYINPAFEKLTGYSRAEAIGQNPRVLKSGKHDQAFYKEMWRTLLQGKVWKGHLTNRRKDGSLFEEEATISAVTDKHDKLTNFVAMKRDVSREVSLEKQLRQAVKLEAIGTLAGGIAHDFNNILASILGYGEMAKVQLSPEDPAAEDIDLVLKAGKRAKNLVKQILAFSRQDEVVFSPLHVQLIVKEALKFLRSSLPATIEIEGEIDSYCRPILGDPVQVNQVILNLCANAKLAMAESGGVLTVSLSEVEVTDSKAIAHCPQLQNGVYLDLLVGDTGCGMDQATQVKIFDPFFTTRDIGAGTGLGLSVVHGIIKQHQGEITVASQPGEGAIFHVYLPIIAEEAANEPQVSPGDVLGGSERIMVVDDEAPIVGVLRRLLGNLGYRVTGFTSSVEAMAAYGAAPDDFDLLITDMTMPGLTGMALAQKVHALRPEMPIILCTGYGEDLDHDEFESHGIAELILKPVLARPMAESIRKVLDRG